MNIDIDKYPVRRSNPIVVGSYGLPKDTERYVIKGQGLIGIDLDQGDVLFLKNLEGNQVCEITVFDDNGNNNQKIIDKGSDIENSYLKKVLKLSSDKLFLIQKLKNKKINLDHFSSITFIAIGTTGTTFGVSLSQVWRKMNRKSYNSPRTWISQYSQWRHTWNVQTLS